MSPLTRVASLGLPRGPRASGDEPSIMLIRSYTGVWSPRERG